MTVTHTYGMEAGEHMSLSFFPSALIDCVDLCFPFPCPQSLIALSFVMLLVRGGGRRGVWGRRGSGLGCEGPPGWDRPMYGIL